MIYSDNQLDLSISFHDSVAQLVKSGYSRINKDIGSKPIPIR